MAVASALDGQISESDMDRSDDDVSVIPETPFQSEPEDEDGVAILRVAGVAFEYKIPRFPVVSIPIRQFTFEAVLPDGRTGTYDGFIRNHQSLETQNYPMSIRVSEYCFVEVGVKM